MAITTYLAAAGSVNVNYSGTLLLDDGGAVVLSPTLTGFVPDGSDYTIAAGTLVYTLADGTSAVLGNFTGMAHMADGVYTVSGSASGTDGNGHSVTVQDVRYSFATYINPDGTVTKKYTGGNMTLAVN